MNNTPESQLYVLETIDPIGNVMTLLEIENENDLARIPPSGKPKKQFSIPLVQSVTAFSQHELERMKIEIACFKSDIELILKEIKTTCNYVGTWRKIVIHKLSTTDGNPCGSEIVYFISPDTINSIQSISGILGIFGV